MESDPAIDWLVRDIRSHIRKRPKRFQLSDAGAYAQTLYETNTANLPGGHLACGAGCAGCCFSHVGMEMAEAFRLLRFLAETRDADALAAAMEKVRAVAETVGDIDAGTRWEVQVPCVFLDPDSQSCTIYEARPLACRGYTSTDQEACNLSTANLDHVQPIPADAERMVRAQQVRHALGEVAARAAGLKKPVDHMEFHKALLTAWAVGGELEWLRIMKKG